MSEEKKEKAPEQSKKNKIGEKDIGLNLDKMEYQQIVLSQQNSPERDYYFKRDSWD